MTVLVDLLPGTAAGLGDPHARLLAGPVHGTESLSAHECRLGRLDLGSVRLEDIAEGGLTGRGGAGFPLARKLATAREAPGVPLVVVNGSEGEPASRKDHTLLTHRPHLVLDGAVAAAVLAGAEEVVVYVHGGRRGPRAAVETALAERVGRDPVSWHLAQAPEHYLAGESSAVVAVLEGRGPAPDTRRVPAAVRGVGGRPTVVSNAETLAHLALLARFGVGWFAGAGTPGAPGSTLLTLAGSVPAPGRVLELLGPVLLGELLTDAGLSEVPDAVLVGGYAGTWVDGDTAWGMRLDRALLGRDGVGLGCGLIAPISAPGCGLAETGRLLHYLASHTAGQCGPCMFGLPELAGRFAELVNGSAGRRDADRVRTLVATLWRRGGCAHPDGAVLLAESSLAVFDRAIREHRRHGHCPGRDCRASRVLPVPAQLHSVPAPGRGR